MRVQQICSRFLHSRGLPGWPNARPIPNFTLSQQQFQPAAGRVIQRQEPPGLQEHSKPIKILVQPLIPRAEIAAVPQLNRLVKLPSLIRR